MRDKIETILAGGPLDRAAITAPVSLIEEEIYVLDHTKIGGFLPGDQVLAGEPIEYECYKPMQIAFSWPGGVMWTYHLWIHEDATKEGIPSAFHPSSCYVERTRVEEIPQTAINWLQDGIYTPSDN